MTDSELRLAIDQAWAHTQKTAPGHQLEEAKQHLTHLRSVQADRAKAKPLATDWPFRGAPVPPPSTTGI